MPKYDDPKLESSSPASCLSDPSIVISSTSSPCEESSFSDVSCFVLAAVGASAGASVGVAAVNTAGGAIALSSERGMPPPQLPVLETLGSCEDFLGRSSKNCRKATFVSAKIRPSWLPSWRARRSRRALFIRRSNALASRALPQPGRFRSLRKLRSSSASTSVSIISFRGSSRASFTTRSTHCSDVQSGKSSRCPKRDLRPGFQANISSIGSAYPANTMTILPSMYLGCVMSVKIVSSASGP
mmetsp:Transcript_43385/g.102095  ORF Transcript_43385/g.102095 Transcript_43385/m.102095 type:complete len:242 (-) Transcript_43385:185-910(-)